MELGRLAVYRVQCYSKLVRGSLGLIRVWWWRPGTVRGTPRLGHG